MKFINKKILLISPEKWGVNKISKHHYALELAARGNLVFFLDPPVKGLGKVKITSSEIEGLRIVQYSSLIRGLNSLTLILPWLGMLLCKLEINRISKAFLFELDIVWSFDPFRFQYLKHFKSAITIFHPVDFHKGKLDLITAQNADVVFAVSEVILNKYSLVSSKRFLINHGLSREFINRKITTKKIERHISCGYIGNLLSFAIHWENLLRILAENEEIQFHFIGPFSPDNLGSTKGLEYYINKIKEFKNVRLYGSLAPEEISLKIQTFDMFLICYNSEVLGPVVSNSHKILEYLSTGKVIVSSRVSYYDQLSHELFEMAHNNNELPEKFKQVANNIKVYNSNDRQKIRKEFAIANSYSNQLELIERLISESMRNKNFKSGNF